MKIYNICNLFISKPEYFEPFTIKNYTFNSYTPKAKSSTLSIYTHKFFYKSYRNNKITAYASFSGRQTNSFLFNGGLSTRHTQRKEIDDINLILSILLEQNVELASRKYTQNFPVTSGNHLQIIAYDWNELEQFTLKILDSTEDYKWLIKYNNGFHLKKLLTNANLNNTETRFLSMWVLWEWLYAREFGKESFNLNEIMSELLIMFWGKQVDTTIFNKKTYNIYSVLRNQLAHVGEIPINRPYAEPWMMSLNFQQISKYLDFFDRLTQVLILKTVDFHIELTKAYNTMSYDQYLPKFLSKGKIDNFHITYP